MEKDLLCVGGGFLLGALSSYVLFGGRRRRRGGRRRLAEEGKEEEEEEEEEDEEDEDDEEPAANNGYRNFSVLHAPFKMVLCVNMELAMGKGTRVRVWPSSADPALIEAGMALPHRQDSRSVWACNSWCVQARDAVHTVISQRVRCRMLGSRESAGSPVTRPLSLLGVSLVAGGR
jgi:hypothetical protein